MNFIKYSFFSLSRHRRAAYHSILIKIRKDSKKTHTNTLGQVLAHRITKHGTNKAPMAKSPRTLWSQPYAMGLFGCIASPSLASKVSLGSPSQYKAMQDVFV